MPFFPRFLRGHAPEQCFRSAAEVVPEGALSAQLELEVTGAVYTELLAKFPLVGHTSLVHAAVDSALALLQSVAVCARRGDTLQNSAMFMFRALLAKLLSWVTWSGGS